MIDIEKQKQRYDAVCKEILSEKDIAANILETCAEEFHGYPIPVIAGRYITGEPETGTTLVEPDGTATRITGGNTEDKTEKEGTVFYDIRFTATAPADGQTVGLIINIEAQNQWNPGYPLLKRAGYYLSRLVSSQYGPVFTKSHYEKFQKVYSIWICTEPVKEWEYTITRYQMTEEHIIGAARAPKSDYDLMTIVLVCLGRKNYTELEGLLRLLNLLLVDEPGEGPIRETLKEEFSVRMTPRLEKGVAEMCNLSEGVYRRGEAKGIVWGTENANIQTALRLIQHGGFTPEFIASMTSLPLDRVQSLFQRNHLSSQQK